MHVDRLTMDLARTRNELVKFGRVVTLPPRPKRSAHLGLLARCERGAEKVTRATAALVCLIVFAGNARGDTITGAVLADMCVKHEPRASYYILGAVDAFHVRIGGSTRFCIPKGSAIPGDHLTNIACKYAVEHPEQQDNDAGLLIYRSLRDAYPCGTKR